MSHFETFGLNSLFDMEAGTANLYSQGSKDSAGAAIQEKGQENVRRIGRSHFVKPQGKLYPGIDVQRALQRDVPVNFSLDRKMSPGDAGAMTLAIVNRCGLANEDDSHIYAFVKAMLLCMAANSASVLVPGRAKFFVEDSQFDFFTDVMKVLGNDARRYFRAYADITKNHLLDLEKEYQQGPRSEDSVDAARYENVTQMWSDIVEVAEDRGLTRVPYMVHDSAESCTNKTSVEKTYLANCKATMFANGAYQGNLVDHPVVSNVKGANGNVGPTVGATGRNSSAMPEGF